MLGRFLASPTASATPERKLRKAVCRCIVSVYWLLDLGPWFPWIRSRTLWARPACSSLQKLPGTGPGGAEMAPGALELDAASACGGLFAGLLQGLRGLSRLEKRGGSLITGVDTAKGSPRLAWRYSIRGQRQMTTLLLHQALRLFKRCREIVYGTSCSMRRTRCRVSTSNTARTTGSLSYHGLM